MQNVLKRKNMYFVEEKDWNIFIWAPTNVLEHYGSLDMHIKSCKKNTYFFLVESLQKTVTDESALMGWFLIDGFPKKPKSGIKKQPQIE